MTLRYKYFWLLICLLALGFIAAIFLPTGDPAPKIRVEKKAKP
jgi:hypothetical protein